MPRAGARHHGAPVPGLPVQLGGGIRDMATAEAWLGAGVARIILGSAAVEGPAFARAACRAFPGRVALGIDARDGMVATEGLGGDRRDTALALRRTSRPTARRPSSTPTSPATACSSGVNVEATAALARAVPGIPVIASGGVPRPAGTSWRCGRRGRASRARSSAAPSMPAA
jgi:phosphoribosylformimino-5-aminoimidazole carboxamide ribotide isomerase